MLRVFTWLEEKQTGNDFEKILLRGASQRIQNETEKETEAKREDARQRVSKRVQNETEGETEQIIFYSYRIHHHTLLIICRHF